MFGVSKWLRIQAASESEAFANRKRSDFWTKNASSSVSQPKVSENLISSHLSIPRRDVVVVVRLLHRPIVEGYVHTFWVNLRNLWDLRELVVLVIGLLLNGSLVPGEERMLYRNLVLLWVGRGVLRKLWLILGEARQVNEFAVGIDGSLRLSVIDECVIQQARNLASLSIELLLLLALMLWLAILDISIVYSVPLVHINWLRLRIVRRRRIVYDFLRLLR